MQASPVQQLALSKHSLVTGAQAHSPSEHSPEQQPSPFWPPSQDEPVSAQQAIPASATSPRVSARFSAHTPPAQHSAFEAQAEAATQAPVVVPPVVLPELLAPPVPLPVELALGPPVPVPVELAAAPVVVPWVVAGPVEAPEELPIDEPLVLPLTLALRHPADISAKTAIAVFVLFTATLQTRPIAR
jgi:hypothetical protein